MNKENSKQLDDKSVHQATKKTRKNSTVCICGVYDEYFLYAYINKMMNRCMSV